MPKQDTHLTDTHIAAWVHTVRTSQRIVQATEQALKKAGLPPLSWYDVLLELKRARPEGLRPYQLQSAMLIAQYNLSRLIDRIEKRGYVQRFSCDDDGRGQVIRITPVGLELQERMWPVYQQALEREFAARITEKDAATLVRLLS